MKILHVLSSPHLGGAEVMCLLLAREQTALGHDVLVHLFAAGETLDFAESNKVPHVLRELQDLPLGKSDQWAAQEKLLRDTVMEFHPDIVHSHVPITNLFCHRALPGMKIRWVTTVHGSWRQFGYSPDAAQSPLKKPYLLVRHAAGDYLATRSASKVIAISDYVRQQLHQVRISNRRLRIIHDGLPFEPVSIDRTAARKQFDIPEEALVVGSLGHMAPVKGFDLLIAAFSRIAEKNPNAFLIIAGGDILGNTAVRASLNDQITSLNLTTRVRLQDRLDTRQGFFAALDLFAVSSRTEGFSLALVEAMQHGLPSIITSAGGCAEAARPDQESLLFTSGNIDDLAEKLKQLLNNSALRDKLGGSARQRAQDYLTLNRCANEYLNLYEEVVGSNKTS